MKIVVDTNIVFSAILTSTGKIGELLADRPVNLDYIAPEFLLDELLTHTNKILKITKYTEEEYELVKAVVIRDIELINTQNISEANQNKAIKDLFDVDKKDLAYQEDAYLWTGDKKLVRGLSNNSYAKIITTDILYAQYL